MPQRIAFVAVGVLLFTSSAGAQYFGRNKIQYDRLEFRVLQTPHFDIHYYASEREATEIAAQMAERWYTRLSAVLHHQFTRRQPIVFYANHGDFAQTTLTPSVLPDGVGGFTDHAVGRVVLPFSAGFAETDHVLGHELVHSFQRDIVRERGSSLAMLPLWFVEGMAEYLSVGTVDTNTAMWLRDAARAERLPKLEDLNSPKWFPYRYGQALWAYLAEEYGQDIASRALRGRVKGGTIARLTRDTGETSETLSKNWHAWIRRLVATGPTDDEAEARTVIAPGHNGGRLNVGPALSPDGSQVVFLSERDGFSVDVFLADAKTGAVTRKLVSTATSPNLDTIQFIESAGAWDPNGGRLALSSIRDGAAVLTIFNLPDGGVAHEFRIGEVDQISTPAWSADGRRIAFSGLKGGISDLYVLTLATASVRAWTHDLFADLQPAWSPDGTRVAFVTDRFSSDLESLTFGRYGLALVDVASGAVTELPSLQGGKRINPQWSPDGATLYYVGDADGVNNVYALALAPGGGVQQVTRVATGVSGITAASPSLSVASGSGRLAYSVYRGGAYEIRTADAPPAAPADVVATVPLTGPIESIGFESSVHAAAPPVPAPAVSAAPAGGETSEPPAAAPAGLFEDRPYAHKLSIVSIGQPYLTAGGGSFGAFFRAGISFGFGDMLGQQQVFAALQVGKELMDFATQAAYLNRRSRWTWGVIGGQIPSITGLVRTERRVSPDGEDPTIAQSSIFLEQIHRQAGAMLQYPFSRSRRIEFSAGLDSIAFRTDTTTSVFSGTTGRLLAETSEVRHLGETATLFQTGAALVHDTTVHGVASPVLGERYRFGVSPTFGGLTMAAVVADYRRYVMPIRPFTIAVRAQHIGRYGPGAGDPRLLPFIWLVQDVVRGYDGRMLPVRNCDRVAISGCDPVDAATTQRLFAANAEIRFPLAGLLSRKASYGRIPLEGVAFADTASFATPVSDGALTRTLLQSAGVGVRVNAAGFVIEYDLSHPIEHSSRQASPIAPRGWRFSASFRPGF